MTVSLHWVAAGVGALVVVLYGYRTGWLIIAGRQRTLGAWVNRAGMLVVLSFLTSGLFTRADAGAPFEWFHAGLLAGLVLTGVGLVLLVRDGSDPT